MDAGGEPLSSVMEPAAAAMGDEAAKPAEREPPENMPLPHDWNTIYLAGLFLLACLVLAKLAQEVILPLVIAIVLKLLLQPLVRLLERIRLPKALGALVAVLLLLGVFVALGAVLSGPAAEIVHNFPSLLQKAQQRFEAAQQWLEPLLKRIGVEGNPLASSMPSDPGSLAGSVASGASSFASHLLETLLILYYMLVFGETFMRRLVEVLPTFSDKKQAVEIGDTVESDISAYLLTITVINLVVGVLAGTVMWLFGVPGALVWGVLAFCFNYVPILGPLTGVLLFAVVGLASLGATWTALLPAAAYLALHFAEGEMITPMVLAKRFTLNPIAVMIALVFWYWMWGVQGAILSVPLLAITKIVSDRITPLKALGHMLEG